MQTNWVSHLARVNPLDTGRFAVPSRTAIRGGKYRAQWNVRFEGDRAKFDCAAEVVCNLPVRMFRVGSVPNIFPTYGDADDWTERRDAGLYADPLTPVGDRLVLTPNVNNTFYFEIDARAAGVHELRVRLTERGETLAEGALPFRVVVVDFSADAWIFTDWIHFDAVAREHRVRLFDDEFYRVFASYLRLAAEEGANMLMVPAFTPSLDTEVGGERMTAQLVEITETAHGYTFAYEEFDRFVDFVSERGVRYLEFPPLVSQWTGEFAPKFRVRTQSGEETRFGWESSSDSAEYLRFLDAFLTSLAAHLNERNLWDRAWFHLSDEPDAANAARVAAVERVMRARLAGARFFDTVLPASAPKAGFLPVFASEDADARRANGCDVRAVYYCCEQCRDGVSNRFLNMPLVRTAMIGLQMAACGAELLLHWGFNFYNEVLSRAPVDPYADATAGGNYPGGDAFLVYPDRERGGALPSLRVAAMAEAYLFYRLAKTLQRNDPAQADALFARVGLVGYRDRPRTVEEAEAIKESLIAALSAGESAQT